ncbi:replication-associated protein [Pacific flying fox faeces associated circular DNA virus-2]|uniref:Replication-associated protein n=1 Tax=Pacific flying fox faeces associated circular DNA virus-2 TaxID=1796011 RepID=A0A140CTV7_9VIRU|nr:replication-associated protein [Pacific flying fox faeces associated circular DNA virus-2]
MASPPSRQRQARNIIKGLAVCRVPPAPETSFPMVGPIRQRNFRINATRFLLTYPQSTFDVQLVWDFFNSLAIKPKRAIICREHHQDGSEHVHVAIEFERAVNTTRVSIFDFGGRHPNIQSARNWAACVNYCRKEGVIETAYFGCTAEDATVASAPGERAPAESPYARAESARTIREWFEYCIAEGIGYAYANAIWNQIHSVRPPTYFENDFSGIVSGPTLSHLRWDPEWHTIFLCGPSGLGKSSWALANAPVPFLFVTDIDDLGFFDPEVHKALVFDEIRCTGEPNDNSAKGKWPLTSQIKLATWDTPVSIRIRYKIAHLPAHVPKIFTSCDWFPMNGDEQIRRRIKAFNLYEDGRSTESLWL